MKGLVLIKTVCDTIYSIIRLGITLIIVYNVYLFYDNITRILDSYNRERNIFYSKLDSIDSRLEIIEKQKNSTDITTFGSKIILSLLTKKIIK